MRRPLKACIEPHPEFTDRRRAENQLRTANGRLAGVMSAAEIGVWWWDMDTNIVGHDRNLARLYNLGDRIESTVEQHAASIADEDWPIVQAAIANATVTGQFVAGKALRDTLSHALHASGMVLVQDIVVNHTGNYFSYRDRWQAGDPERAWRGWEAHDQSPPVPRPWPD